MRKMSTIVLAGACALVLASCAATDQAATDQGEDGAAWEPSGDVEFVIPASAGGGSDLFGRAISAGLDGSPSTNIVLRPGGSSAVGFTYVLGKPGNAEVITTTDNTVVTAPMTIDVPFSVEDFTPLALLAEDYTLAVVRDDAPYENCTDLVNAAEKDTLFVGISGQTGPDTINIALLEEEADVSFQRVPYESGAEMVTALLGGSITFAPLSAGEVIGQVQSGDLRPLCVFAPERLAGEGFSDAPTAIEEGYDVAFAQFRGVLAPKDLTTAQRDYWYKAIEAAANSEAFDEYITTNLLTKRVLIGKDFEDFLEENRKQLESIL